MELDLPAKEQYLAFVRERIADAVAGRVDRKRGGP
jgi:hypothetical protein